MKRVFLVSIIAVSIVLLSLSNNTAVLAADYTITINDTNLTKNQDLVFSESDIGPGFTKTYNIHIINKSSETVVISIWDYILSAASTLTLNEIYLTFTANDEIMVDTLNGPSRGMLACVGPSTRGNIHLTILMDPNLGNEYQNKSFELEMPFMGYVEKCDLTGGFFGLEDETDPSPDPGKESHLKLPKTGESRGFYYFLYGATAISALVTIIMLIVFIITRKHRREDKQHEENSV
ncbi:hypothetical protein FWC31_03650 [Candidatus Saccharibacteria bacterium]|nr:hypothetical protein [Candidatus Saccharibacteria bacterium]